MSESLIEEQIMTILKTKFGEKKESIKINNIYVICVTYL